MYRLLDWRRFLVADKFVSQRSIPQAIYRFPSCVHHISNMEHFRNLPEASAYQPPHLGSGDLAKSPNSAPRGLRVEPGMYEQQSRGCGRCCDEGRHRMVVETSGDTRKVASPASHSSDIWPECLRINLFAKPLLLFFIPHPRSHSFPLPFLGNPFFFSCLKMVSFACLLFKEQF